MSTLVTKNTKHAFVLASVARVRESTAHGARVLTGGTILLSFVMSRGFVLLRIPSSELLPHLEHNKEAHEMGDRRTPSQGITRMASAATKYTRYVTCRMPLASRTRVHSTYGELRARSS